MRVTLRRLLSLAGRLLLNALVTVVPTDKGLWVVRLRQGVGNHANNDNLTVLWEYAVARGIRVVVLADATPSAKARANRSPVVSAGSIRGVVALARASVIVVDGTDSVGVGPCRPMVVNVWHGVPLKTLGTASNAPARWKARLVRRSRRLSLTISSSHVDRLAMGACFGVSLDKVVVTGLPRYDWLLCAESDLPPDQREALHRLRTLTGGRRLLLVAPTYRGWPSDHMAILMQALLELQDEFERHGVLPGLRPHPFEIGNAAAAAQTAGWPLLMPDEWPETQMVLGRAAHRLLVSVRRLPPLGQTNRGMDPGPGGLQPNRRSVVRLSGGFSRPSGSERRGTARGVA